MTRISPILYPTPAGHTKAATHGTKASSCRDQFGAVTSVKGNQCAPEATPRPQRVKGPQHTIPQAFERLNAPQMRRDALPPVWLMIVSALTCLFALLVADTLYSKFFEWMVLK